MTLASRGTYMFVERRGVHGEAPPARRSPTARRLGAPAGASAFRSFADDRVEGDVSVARGGLLSEILCLASLQTPVASLANRRSTFGAACDSTAGPEVRDARCSRERSSPLRGAVNPRRRVIGAQCLSRFGNLMRRLTPCSCERSSCAWATCPRSISSTAAGRHVRPHERNGLTVQDRRATRPDLEL